MMRIALPTGRVALARREAEADCPSLEVREAMIVDLICSDSRLNRRIWRKVRT